MYFHLRPGEVQDPFLIFFFYKYNGLLQNLTSKFDNELISPAEIMSDFSLKLSQLNAISPGISKDILMNIQVNRPKFIYI